MTRLTSGPAAGLFEEFTKTVIPNAHFVDNWADCYSLDGEFHCGTYVVRQPYSLDW